MEYMWLRPTPYLGHVRILRVRPADTMSIEVLDTQDHRCHRYADNHGRPWNAVHDTYGHRPYIVRPQSALRRRQVASNRNAYRGSDES